MLMFKRLLVIVVIVGSFSVLAENVATLRKHDLNKKASPPQMPNVENKDLKRQRNYPMQPPTIPHKIDQYQVDLRSNKCMSCHSRTRTSDSQAPMVSVTHFMNRDGNFLAEISPRRYFCQQCHVPQTEAKVLVENDFEDMNSVVKGKKQ